ncbi:MAG: tRNA 2-thiocytidine(32) synthetase TtcA [Vicinamibacterales bacterium]|nr:tRNA 2-thiocytidine(32) synthetase TtcA [Vicinamibacterales bacterium]
MGYRSTLESRIAKKATKAITEYSMIEDGDRVMVGLSGGKDSWALLQTLDELRQRAPIQFSLVAVNVDSGYKDYKHGVIAEICRARGWELHIEHTAIGEVMDDILADGATPCSLCARLRRGVLYRVAREVGATKIALGHHLDDFVETLLLNVFFAGALKAMPARLLSDNGEHVVVRPFVYVTEEECRAYARERELPVIGCCCPACGDLSLQRQRIKKLIFDLEQEHPGVRHSMITALGNVMPRHLLDRRLNPVADLAAMLPADPDTPALPALIPLLTGR